MCQTWQTLWSIINFSLIEEVKSLLQLAIINDRANGDVRPCQSRSFLQFSCLCSFQFPSRLNGKPRVVTRTLWPSISLELQVASSWLSSSLHAAASSSRMLSAQRFPQGKKWWRKSSSRQLFPSLTLHAGYSGGSPNLPNVSFLCLYSFYSYSQQWLWSRISNSLIIRSRFFFICNKKKILSLVPFSSRDDRF